MNDQTQNKFWQRVDRGGPDECWNWAGKLNKQGYGHLMIGEKWTLSHRYAYEITYGFKYPTLTQCSNYAMYMRIMRDGWIVRHKCDNRACCNPAHLEIGTYADNSRDMKERGRARNQYTKVR